MLLIAGLGNPGARYAGHRHNVGFMAVDAIHAVHGFAAWRNRFQGHCAEGRLGEQKCLLLKPATYMNESGRAVGEAAGFYKLTGADVVVVHDELDLAPGKLKMKTGGGDAGHNGLRSISASAIGRDYRRMRIGVGHPGRKEAVTGWVLRDFAKADREDWLDPLLDAIARAAPFLAQGDDPRFLTEVARWAAPAEPRRRAAAGTPAGAKAGPGVKAAPGGGAADAGAAAGAAAENASRPSASPPSGSATAGGPFARLRKLFGD